MAFLYNRISVENQISTIPSVIQLTITLSLIVVGRVWSVDALDFGYHNYLVSVGK